MLKTVAASYIPVHISDMFNDTVRIRPDGRVLEKLYLMQAKSLAESVYQDDFYTQLSSIPGEEAFRSVSESECNLVQR